MRIIAPSVLAVDFTRFSEQIKQMNESKAKWIHFDVMDGHFVPNISYGPKILEDVKKISPLFCDVHLMVSNPKDVIPWFINEGSDLITFHIEAVSSVEQAKELINLIKEANIKVGVSIKPNTPVESINELLSELDLVLVMSVEPGFGGQKFMPSSLDKIKKLVNLRNTNNYSYLIEVDGGINYETGVLVKEAGVDVLVAGSYVFNGSVKEQIESLL